MEELARQIPYGLQALAIVVAVASLVSAAVPDEKMPTWVSAGLNFLAANVGKAKNSPNQ
jgi:hypothetical protein